MSQDFKEAIACIHEAADLKGVTPDEIIIEIVTKYSKLHLLQINENEKRSV